jgi:chromosome segregation ATPase
VNPLESLNLLEKKIEILMHQLEITKKENHELQNLIQIERERNSKLEHEIVILKQEKQTFDVSKQEIRSRIEDLIKKLTSGSKNAEFVPQDYAFIRKSGSTGYQQPGYSGGIDMMDDDSSNYYDEI